MLDFKLNPPKAHRSSGSSLNIMVDEGDRSVKKKKKKNSEHDYSHTEPVYFMANW